MRKFLYLSVVCTSLIQLSACSKSEVGTNSQQTAPSGAKITVSSVPVASAPVETVQLPLALTTQSSGFDNARPNQILDIPVTITNKGNVAYNDPTNISYHWFDATGKEIVHDGDRTALKLPIPVDSESSMTVRVYAPKDPGSYVVQVDLVKEGQYWFADKGMAPVRLPVDVKNPN